jgi:hypothetical protein
VISHFSDENIIENLYGSKDTFERVQLEKKFADKDIDAVRKIYNSDLNTLGDMEAILLADKLKHKNSKLSDDKRITAIRKRMGIDEGVDDSELDATQEYEMSFQAAEAREALKGIKEFKPEDPKFDWYEEAKANRASFEEKQKALSEGWTQAATDVLSAYEGTKAFTKNGDKLEELLSYTADDKFKQEILPQAIKDFASQGLDPSKDENRELLSNYIDQQHKLYAFDKIIKKAIDDAKTKTEDDVHKEIHNDKPQNTTEAPPVGTDTKMSIQEFWESKKK